MTKRDTNRTGPKSSKRRSRRLSGELRREQILRVAEKQFAAGGFVGTNTAGVAKTAGISEAMIFIHFGTKRKLFEAAVERNTQGRLATLRERFFAIPNLPPLECIEKMAESTVLACVDENDNASIMVWALMELPEFATDLYRAEIGTTEALWDAEIETHLAESPLRRRLSVHLVPLCSAHLHGIRALAGNPASQTCYGGGARTPVCRSGRARCTDDPRLLPGTACGDGHAVAGASQLIR